MAETSSPRARAAAPAMAWRGLHMLRTLYAPRHRHTLLRGLRAPASDPNDQDTGIPQSRQTPSRVGRAEKQSIWQVAASGGPSRPRRMEPPAPERRLAWARPSCNGRAMRSGSPPHAGLGRTCLARSGSPWGDMRDHPPQHKGDAEGRRGRKR